MTRLGTGALSACPQRMTRLGTGADSKPAAPLTMENTMSEGLSDQDRDCLVAAILSAPRIDTHSTPEERVAVFSQTLKELARHGGSAALRGDHAKAVPAK